MTDDIEKRGGDIPEPPDPKRRAERLPWETVKSVEDDPEALRRVRSLMGSPSYRRADLDAEFMGSDDLRGVRLELDYLKPELLLRQQGVAQTIVVFGGTRIPEPAEAGRRLALLQEASAANPEPERLSRWSSPFRSTR